MKSTNYDQFKKIHTNRVINQGLVKSLIKSIEEIGYIEARPVIVSESMEIIDGQHRFEACKRLGLPIIYSISDVDPKKGIIALNMNQQIWHLLDYVTSWANDGKECYKKLLEFENKYDLGISNSIVICHAGSGVARGKRGNLIREGKEFTINPNRFEIAEFIMSCKPILPFYKTKQFVESIELLFQKTNSKERQKVFNRIQSIRQQVNTKDYLVCYENILNRYASQKTKIAL